MSFVFIKHPFLTHQIHMRAEIFFKDCNTYELMYINIRMFWYRFGCLGLHYIIQSLTTIVDQCRKTEMIQQNTFCATCFFFH